MWGDRYLFKLVFSFSSNKYPEVDLMDHMIVLFLIFWGNSILFLIVAECKLACFEWLANSKQKALNCNKTSTSISVIQPSQPPKLLHCRSFGYLILFLLESLNQSLFMGFCCKKLPSLAAHFTTLGWQLLAVSWIFLGISVFTNPEPLTLHQLFIMPWVYEAAPHKLGMATEAS